LEALGISIPTLIAQLIAFGILFVLLRVFAYKPIMKMLDERAKLVKEGMEQTEQIKAQATHAEEAVKQQIETGRKEGQEIITRAIHTGEELRHKAEQEARQQGEALIAKARVEIQRERNEAIGELRQEFADLTIVAAERVIEKSLDKEAHRQIIDKVLDESSNLKKK
jgi:F-type H+-transporting ATPase subunit b